MEPPKRRLPLDTNSLEVINEAVQSRGLIELTVAGRGLFITRIVSIHRDLLLLDKLEPPKRARKLLAETEAHVRYLPLGIGVYTFDSRLVAVPDAPSHWALKMPTDIRYIQRRDAYRVTPMHSLPAVCVSLGGRSAAPETQVENISLTGMCLSFPKSVELREGANLPDVCLLLNRTDALMLDGEVRHTWEEPSGRFFVGIAWKRVPRSRRQVLNAYLLACQRLMLRRGR